jgi:hypothetical protein
MLAPPPLPAWCLGPLGDVDMDMDDTDVLSPFEDDDPLDLEGSDPLNASAGASLLPLTAAVGLPSAAAPSNAAVGCYTSLQAQLAHLEQVVALEASLAAAAPAAGQGGFASGATSGDGTASPTGSGASSGAGSAVGVGAGACAGGGGAMAGGGPLGLKLRKSASLVDLVASTLSGASDGMQWRA